MKTFEERLDDIEAKLDTKPSDPYLRVRIGAEIYKKMVALKHEIITSPAPNLPQERLEALKARYNKIVRRMLVEVFETQENEIVKDPWSVDNADSLDTQTLTIHLADGGEAIWQITDDEMNAVEKLLGRSPDTQHL